LTILAVPPVLTSIHRDLHLDETAVGALTGLPVLLLALGAVWGSLLVSKLGARRALVLGLLLVAVGGAARGIGPATPVLFVMTIVMGVGVAVSQPTLPSLVRQWVPRAAGPATAVYSNGLLVGEVLAAALTAPLILPLVGQSWEWAFMFWSVPVALTAAAVMRLSTHDDVTAQAAGVRWWPDWRSGLTWRLGLILGCASAAYFGSNAFIPDYLKATHHAGLITAALTSLNLAQIPASIAVATRPRLLVGWCWPIVCAGAGVLVAAAGFEMGGGWVVAWAGVMGLSNATVFVLTLALPPLLAREHDVHRLTAAIFTISYLCPFVASLTSGAIWDGTGIPFTGFVPVAAAGIAMVVLVHGLDLSRARPPYGESLSISQEPSPARR
jgi:CP family cyanate transporter-like MFS transporter